MKTLNKLRAASIATLAVAAVSLPTLAQANDYNRYYDASAECRSDENEARLIGGLLGAVVGGVVGSEVSGNGARTEGSAIGAVVGGLAGAGIGDESVNCDKRRYETRRGDNYYTNTGYRNTSPVTYRNDGYRTTTRTGYRNDGYRPAAYDSYRRDYHRGNNYGYNDRYEYKNHGQWMKQKKRLRKELRKIERRKYRVKADLKELHYNKRYMPRWEFKRIRSGLYEELEFLQKRERRLERKLGYRTARYYN